MRRLRHEFGRWKLYGARNAMLSAALLAAPGGAQNPQYQHGLPHAGAPMDMGDPAAEYKRLQALNAERHKAIVSDTDKLVKLAGELELEVRNSDSDKLTPMQLHKLEMIEKLARGVKDKMTYSFAEPAANPLFPPPFSRE